MRIQSDGSVVLGAEIATVRSFVLNPEEVFSCIPDASNFAKTGDRQFTINMGVGISVVKGTIRMDGSIAETGNDQVTYTFQGKGLGSTVKMSLSIKLSGSGSSTSIDWKSDAEFTGIISGVSESIIRKATDEKVSEIISKVKEKIEKGPV